MNGLADAAALTSECRCDGREEVEASLSVAARRGSSRRHWIVPTDSEAVKAWRMRMSTDEGKKIYKERGSTAELVNAQCRAQGLGQFLVRGLRKVLAVAVLHAITHNMRRGWALA